MLLNSFCIQRVYWAALVEACAFLILPSLLVGISIARCVIEPQQMRLERTISYLALSLSPRQDQLDLTLLDRYAANLFLKTSWNRNWTPFLRRSLPKQGLFLLLESLS